MSERDAYGDDMVFLHPLDIDDPELAPVVQEVRTLFRRPPAPAVQARHVAAIVDLAKGAPSDPHADGRTGGRPVRLMARLGIVAAAFGLLTGGLALAGVDLPVLPDRASDESRDAGVKGATKEGEGATEEVIVPTVDQLPENAGDTARNVIATIETNLPLLNDDELSGCEFGAMVSAAARGLDADTTHCQEGGDAESTASQGDTAERVLAVIETNLPLLHDGEISGCEFGAMVSAAARDAEPDTSKCAGEREGDRESKGSEASADGKARAEEAKAAGRAKGEEASGGVANAGGNAGTGSKDSNGQSDAGSENAAGGKEVAAEAKAAGWAKGEEASGGKANPGGNSPTD
jgi:hypothetical protein